MNDDIRQQIARQLMQQGDNPLVDYMGQRASNYHENGAWNWMIRNGLAGGAGVAKLLGSDEAAARYWEDAMRAHGAMRNSRDMQTNVEQGAAMWRRSGLPRRPDGK